MGGNVNVDEDAWSYKSNESLALNKDVEEHATQKLICRNKKNKENQIQNSKLPQV